MLLEVFFVLEFYSKFFKCIDRVKKLIEGYCLLSLLMNKVNLEGRYYEIMVEYSDYDLLDEILDELFYWMYEIVLEN